MPADHLSPRHLLATCSHDSCRPPVPMTPASHLSPQHLLATCPYNTCQSPVPTLSSSHLSPQYLPATCPQHPPASHLSPKHLPVTCPYNTCQSLVPTSTCQSPVPYLQAKASPAATIATLLGQEPISLSLHGQMLAFLPPMPVPGQLYLLRFYQTILRIHCPFPLNSVRTVFGRQNCGAGVPEISSVTEGRDQEDKSYVWVSTQRVKVRQMLPMRHPLFRVCPVPAERDGHSPERHPSWPGFWLHPGQHLNTVRASVAYTCL